MHFTDFVVHSGVIKDAFGCRGLSGVDVGHDANISNAVKGMSAWHEKSASVSSGQGFKVLQGQKLRMLKGHLRHPVCRFVRAYVVTQAGFITTCSGRKLCWLRPSGEYLLGVWPQILFHWKRQEVHWQVAQPSSVHGVLGHSRQSI